MQILLRINKKILELDPNILINILQENDSKKIIKGFELVIDIDNFQNTDYVDEILPLIKYYDYVLQFQTLPFQEIDMQRRYLDYYAEIANKLNRNIQVTFQSIVGYDLDGNIRETDKVMHELLKHVKENEYNLTLCLANWNTTPRFITVDKDDMDVVFERNSSLKFAYDLGREIASFGGITDLSEEMANKISTVKIHSFDESDIHRVLYFKDQNKQLWVKGLLYLKSLKYEGPIVLEYSIAQFEGNTLEEKVNNYIKSASIVNDYVN